jgi:hypothetical protein
MFKNIALVLVSAMALAASVASAEIIDYDLSTATIASGANGAVVYNRINGAGYAFTAAHLANGTVVDGTITLTLVNYLGNPLANRPAVDFWLDTSASGINYAPGGTIADGPTNASGQTVWQQPLPAGGCTLSETVVVFALGLPLNQAGINLHFVSGDINGDLAVNISDLSTFAAAYTVAYNACADLFYDGAVNLSDLTLFSQAYGL